MSLNAVARKSKPKSKPELTLAQEEQRVQAAFVDVLNEVRELSKDEKRSTVFLELEIQKLLDYSRELGLESDGFKEYFDEQKKEWQEEIQKFSEVYEQYKIDGFFTLKLSEALYSTMEAKDDINEAKKRKKLEAKIKRRLGNLDVEDFIINNYTNLPHIAKEGYKETSSMEIEFKVDGIEIKLSAKDVEIREYGGTMVVEEISLNGVKIPFLQKSIFDKMANGIEDLVKEFGTLSPAQQKGQLIYSPHLKKILLQQKDSQKNDQFPTYEIKGDATIVYSADGSKLYQKNKINGAEKYQMFLKDGTAMPTYDEFSANHTDKENSQELFAQMLADNLDTDEKLNAYMQVMFTYINDEKNIQYWTGTVFRKKNSFGKKNTSRDKWQPWEETASRVSPAGQHLGDCDDYAMFLKKILQLQGKSPQVLLIPSHATTIWAEKDGDSYVIKDLGTFPLVKVKGKTLEQAFQKILDRYKESGLGVWEGSALAANKHNVSIASIGKQEDGMVHSKYFALPIEALVDKEIAADFTDFQNLLHEGLLLKGKTGSSKMKAKVRQSLEALKEKYGNDWFKNIFKTEKFPLLALYEAAVSEMEGSNQKAITEFIEQYIASSETVTQATFDMLLGYNLTSEHEAALTLTILEKMNVLPSVKYDKQFSFFLDKSKSSGADYQKAMALLKEIADTKMNNTDKIQVYTYFLENKGQTGLSREEVADFLFEQDNPIAFMPDQVTGYTKFSNLFDSDTITISPEKQVSYCLKALKAFPEHPFFQSQLLKALLKARKFSTLEYLITENENIRALYDSFDSQSTQARAYLSAIKVEALSGLGKPKEAFGEIKTNTIRNTFNKSTFSLDRKHRDHTSDVMLSVLKLYPEESRQLLQEEIERQFDLRKRGLSDHQLNKNKEVIPLLHLLEFSVRNELEQGNYEQAEAFYEKNIFNNSNVNVVIQHLILKSTVNYLKDLFEKEEVKNKTGLKEFATYLLGKMDVVKTERLAITDDQIRESASYMDYQGLYDTRAVEHYIEKMKEKLNAILATE